MHFNNQQEINQKVDYLKDKYSVPPQAVIFVGDPGWYVCKPLFDTIWKGVPTIICHSMPHTSADKISIIMVNIYLKTRLSLHRKCWNGIM